MSINEGDFRGIMAEYEKIRSKNEAVREERKKEVALKLPKIKELEDKAAEAASFYGKKSIGGDEMALSSLHEELEEITRERRELLISAGFPEDYLKPVYDCPDCKDTGYIGEQKCHCLRQRIIDALYKQSHITGALERENFETCDMERFSKAIRSDMEKVYSEAREYVKTFATSYRNMLFLGSVGGGKTFLANCIAKALLDKGYSVIYFSAFRLFELIADNTFRHNDPEERGGFFSNIYDSDLLIIDDLGTENINSFVATQLFNILNERNIRRRSTIISSNLSLEKIKDIYSERSLSRIIGNFELYYFRGEDLRMKV